MQLLLPLPVFRVCWPPFLLLFEGGLFEGEEKSKQEALQERKHFASASCCCFPYSVSSWCAVTSLFFRENKLCICVESSLYQSKQTATALLLSVWCPDTLILFCKHDSCWAERNLVTGNWESRAGLWRLLGLWWIECMCWISFYTMMESRTPGDQEGN